MAVAGVDPERISIELELAGVERERAELRSLKDLAEGRIRVGERPDIVARAIRSGCPIALKYTQSFRSLWAVLQWASQSDVGDHEIVEWTTNQLRRIAPHLCERYGIAVRREQEGTPRERFVARYRKMVDEDVLGMEKLVDADPFFGREFRRIVEANRDRAAMLKQTDVTLPLQSVCAVLAAGLRLKVGGALRFAGSFDATFRKKYEISPFLALRALFDAYSRTMSWDSIMSSALVREKALFGMRFIEPLKLEVVLRFLERAGVTAAERDRIGREYG